MNVGVILVQIRCNTLYEDSQKALRVQGFLFCGPSRTPVPTSEEGGKNPLRHGVAVAPLPKGEAFVERVGGGTE